MSVSGKATIVKVDNGKHTMQIKMKNGDKITLTYDSSTNIASGYTPQKGDSVKVVYGSTSKTLKDLQLVDRPSDSKKAKSGDNAKAEDGGGDSADSGDAGDAGGAEADAAEEE